MKEPFLTGEVVTSDYRVPPFLVDETLVVDRLSNVGKKTKPEWRVFVKSASRPGVEGWLDATWLTRVG